jgi:transposase
MEATGVYYENLAHHLHRLKQPVAVILPNKVKHFAQSLNIKTKTDPVDARIIALLGAERKLSLWNPPPVVFKLLRDLTREYSELKKQQTVFKNRLDSSKSSFEPHPAILKSKQDIIKKLDDHIIKLKAEVERLINSEQWLAEKVEKIITIKGVGLMTVATILAETQGFEFVQNTRQLCSYAGYDVVQRESGTSVKGKTRISKKGNGRIRAALHFPAVVASTYNPSLRKVYQRINENKPSKMVGVTALQRKILVLIYTLWKNDSVFRDDYVLGLEDQKDKEKKAGRGISSLPAQDELQPKRLKLSFS